MLHPEAAKTFAVMSCDTGGTVFTTQKWKPPSSCDTEVIAPGWSNSSVGSELSQVNKEAVKSSVVVGWMRLLEIPSSDLRAEHETSQPTLVRD